MLAVLGGLASASSPVARHAPLGARDSSSTTAAAKKLLAGEEIATTTATLGQVIDTTGAVVAGGRPPRSPARCVLVAVGLAPDFFTTAWWDGEPDARARRAPARRTPPSTAEPLCPNGGALQIATLLNVDSQAQDSLALALLGAVAFVGVLRRRRAGLAGWPASAAGPRSTPSPTPSRTWRRPPMSPAGSRPGGPDELGRLRRTFNRLLEALESTCRAQSPVGARRLARTAVRP